MVKERITKTGPKNIFYKMPKVYLEDLRDIEDCIIEEKLRYKIISGGYSYDNIDELIKDKKTINDIKVKIYEQEAISFSHISLELNNNNSYLYIFNDIVANRGITSSIDNIIKKRQRKVFWFLSNIHSVAPIIATFSIINLVILLKKQATNIWFVAICIFLFILSLIWEISTSVESTHHYSRLYLEEKKNISWFRQNKIVIMQFAIGIIGSSVGAVVGSIITYYLMKNK